MTFVCPSILSFRGLRAKQMGLIQRASCLSFQLFQHFPFFTLLITSGYVPLLFYSLRRPALWNIPTMNAFIARNHAFQQCSTGFAFFTVDSLQENNPEFWKRSLCKLPRWFHQWPNSVDIVQIQVSPFQNLALLLNLIFGGKQAGVLCRFRNQG